MVSFLCFVQILVWILNIDTGFEFLTGISSLIYSIFYFTEALLTCPNSFVTCGDGEKLCSTAYGTPGTAHSACLPYLPPSPYSASLGEVEALGPDPECNQSQCETVYLQMKGKHLPQYFTYQMAKILKKKYLSTVSWRC